MDGDEDILTSVKPYNCTGLTKLLVNVSNVVESEFTVTKRVRLDFRHGGGL